MSAANENEEDLFSQKVTIDALEELDFNVIEDMPWAQRLWSDVETHTKRGFLNWCKIVKNVAGTKDVHIQQWSKLYCETVDEILCDMLLDVLRVERSTINKIQDFLKRLQVMCVELHQPIPQKIGEKKLSLYEEQELLMKHIQQYEVVINEKKQELKNLHEKQQRLCKHLGQEPKINLQYPPMPTAAQMEEFQKYIEQLEEEKFEREEEYALLKHEIMEFVNEINYKPTSDFERKVLSSDHFFVTNEDMKKIRLFGKCIKQIKKSTEEEISQLRGRIEDLWKMLDVDLMDRDDFRTHYTGNSLDTLEALRIEIRRCEEIRKANIQNFVEKLRVELESVWRKCHCTDLEKRTFRYFHNDCYTEDLLDIHELEIQKWKRYFDENERLLGLLEKHQELWEKAIELEENATGPNRYKNRGGKLLLEEKERNKLSKQIPKIEEDIRSLSEEFTNNTGRAFLTYGRTPEEYLEHIHVDRENNRKLKLSARKMQRDNTLALTPNQMKSAISLFPSTSRACTPTPKSATKRKILATPNTDVKRPRVIGTPRNPIVKTKATTATTTTGSVSRIKGIVPKITVTHATMTLPRQKRKSRSSMDKTKRRRSTRKSRSGGPARQVPTVVECNDTRNTTYSDFQNELSSREVGRSTILPDEMRTPAATSKRGKLAPRGTPMFKTPSRTPLAAKMPQSNTPNGTGKKHTKLSACKSNLKMLF